MNHHIATPKTMSVKPHFSIRPAALFIAMISLVGCSGLGGSAANPLNWITPYKIDVIQGNFVSKEQVEQLRVGMIREQVKATLGTPLARPENALASSPMAGLPAMSSAPVSRQSSLALTASISICPMRPLAPAMAM